MTDYDNVFLLKYPPEKMSDDDRDAYAIAVIARGMAAQIGASEAAIRHIGNWAEVVWREYQHYTKVGVTLPVGVDKEVFKNLIKDVRDNYIALVQEMMLDMIVLELSLFKICADSTE